MSEVTGKLQSQITFELQSNEPATDRCAAGKTQKFEMPTGVTKVTARALFDHQFRIGQRRYAVGSALASSDYERSAA